MTIYQKATGKVEILNAREKAPLAATEDMFLGDPELSLYGKKELIHSTVVRTLTF